MLGYNEIKEGKYLVLQGEPYEVLSSQILRKQQRRPVNTVRLKHLITGRVVDYSFHQSDQVAEAEIVEKEAVYLYSRRGEHWFADPAQNSRRFKLGEAQVGERIRFLPAKTSATLLSFNNQIIGLRLPIKVTLKVIEAPPGLRGDTAQGGNKKVVLETGAEITAPLFVETGDRVVVNTETGEYVSRAD